MTVADVETAMRLAASAWCADRDIVFTWDNGPSADPSATQTLEWEFRVASEERRTVNTVVSEGTAIGRIYSPAGRGMLAALQLAESLQAEFAGKLFGDGEAGDEVEIRPLGRDGADVVVEVVVPWELDEARIPIGAVGLQGAATEASAYQAFRARWDGMVRAPLSLRTFFDDSPPDATVAPPWCFASWKTLRPVRLETHLQRVPGRVIAALNFPMGTGVLAANTAASAIAKAFTEVSTRGLVFGTPTTTRVGRTALNTWQTNVRLPFHYDQRI